MAAGSLVAERATSSHIAVQRAGGHPTNVGALVLGGAHGSLAVVRSLGRRGVPVWVVTAERSIAQYSRYSWKTFAWPGADDAGAVDFFIELAEREKLQGWVVFPGGDKEARFISVHRPELERVFRLTTPPWATLQWAAEKNLTYQLAAEIGVDCPWTMRPRGRRDLEDINCGFPVILKPSARNSANAFTHAKAWRIDDRASLLARYETAVAMVGADSVLLQELIPGNGSAQYSFTAVCEDGVPLAWLTARRLRQYPIDFGYTSTFVESVENREIEEASRRFLRATAYSGMVELEFKYDHRDGRYKLLDVNARTWAWVALGAKAGVDFPWLMWQLAMGETAEPARARVGCAWAHFSRDLAAAAAEMRARTLSPGRYWKSLRTSLVFAAFASDDPLPGILDLPLTISRFLAR